MTDFNTGFNTGFDTGFETDTDLGADRDGPATEAGHRTERHIVISAPGRVVVTSPRTRAATRPRHAGTREIDEQTRLGEVYMRSLIRFQLRIALSVCIVVACLVGGLPALFILAPGFGRLRLLGVPLPWLILAGLIYPLFIVCAWWYVRQAENTERDFAELVDHK